MNAVLETGDRIQNRKTKRCGVVVSYDGVRFACVRYDDGKRNAWVQATTLLRLGCSQDQRNQQIEEQP